MGTAKKIAQNTFILMLAQIISTVFGFFYLVIIARYLGDAGFGVLSFALAVTGMFSVVADLGLSVLTTREIARNKSLAGKYIGNLTMVKLVLSVITFGLIFATVMILGYPQETVIVVCLVAISTILMTFTNLFYGIFQAYDEMKYQGVGQFLNSLIMFSGVVVVEQLGYGIIEFSLVYCIAAATVFIYSIATCARKFVAPRIEIDMKFIKPTFMEALPYGMSGLFVTIFYWIGSVMLSYMHGDEAVGWYNGAYRLILFILFIPTMVSVSIFPAMARLHVSSQDMLRFATDKYFKYMAVIALPMGVGTTLLADKIILTIFGSEYVNSIIVLQVLIWSAVFIFLGSAFARLLESSNMQMAVTKITATCMVLNITLNLILIPVYSYVGASVTTTITELISFVLCFYACIRLGKVGYAKNLKDISKPFIASLIMGASIYLLMDQSVFLLIPAAAVFYFVVLYVLGGFEDEDIVLFKSIIKKESPVADNK
ncbi:flippase [Methanooceanicella nereidis]|nr:flippase [Methanocella sp. CWC-04]